MRTSSPTPPDHEACCEQLSDSSAIAHHIEDLTRIRVALFSSPGVEYDSPNGRKIRVHLAPDYRGFNDAWSGTLTFKQQCANVVVSDMKIDETALTMDTRVDSDFGYTTVFVHSKIQGFMKSQISYPYFTEDRWKRDDSGRWTLLMSWGVRAPECRWGNSEEAN